MPDFAIGRADATGAGDLTGAPSPGRADAAPPSPLADEPRKVDVVSSERVFAGKVWDIRRDEVRLRDGAAPIVREYMDHTGAVGVLALDDHDRVFLIQQYRHAVRTMDWEIPAGLLDIDGEPPLDAARRELAEEADLVATDWSVLSDILTSPGGSDEAIRIYLARGLSSTHAPFAREDEEADMPTRWVPLDDCVDAVLARRIRNAPLAVAVLAAHAARARRWATLAPADAPWERHPKAVNIDPERSAESGGSAA